MDEAEEEDAEEARAMCRISVARDKLGWEPKVRLEDGLAPTIAYFRDLLQVG